MSKEQIAAFGAYLENAITGVKQANGRAYGALPMTPRSSIGYIVRKSDVMID
jgi:hypothetical protein